MNRRLGTVLMIAGAALAAVGAIGLVSDDGDSKPAPAATPTGEVTTSTSRATTTSTTEAAAPTTEELVSAFYEVFGAAFREAETDFLFERLHPEVIALYGEDQCRAFIEKVPDNRSFEILEVHNPAPWNYGEREGREIPIEDAIQVDVIQRIDDRDTQLDSHLAVVGDEVRWFTDCGEPIPA
ncbi:MAG: hypothetical protein HYU28_09250 [Actinobacteria bacterium]|nr:hypothetical protein [Actinomycetota bacterium]